MAAKLTMLDLRLNTRRIIKSLREGVPFVLTYRGRPVANLDPIIEKAESSSADPFYGLCDDAREVKGASLSAREADRIIYER